MVVLALLWAAALWITRKQGSFTIEECLADLVRRELVDRRDALTRAGHPDELEHLLK